MKNLQEILETSLLSNIEDTLSVNKNDLSKKFNVNVPFKSFEDAILSFEFLLNQDAKYIKSDGTITVSSEIKRGVVTNNDTFNCGFSHNRKIAIFNINDICKQANVGHKGKKKVNNIKNVILEIRDCKSHLRFQIKLENDKDIYYCRYFDHLLNNSKSLVDTINLFSYNESVDILKMIINKYTK